MSEILVKVRNLKKYFKVPQGKVKAVDDVSFDIYQGETLALVGESGCGKSTLGRLIVRLLKADSGKVEMEGVDLGSLSGNALRHKRAEIQMVFQDPYSSLDPHFTVGEIIAEPLRAMNMPKAEREERVKTLLGRVGLAEDNYWRYPHQFSGGQRQRIGIARSLAPQPKLIVCDEPVSALDVSIQAQILNLLRKLQKESNLTYLFISHDLAVVRYLSDRVVVMFLGKLCEISPTAEAYEKPLHPYTKMLIDSAPEPDPDFNREDRMLLEGELPSPINPPAGCRFCTRCPYATEICSSVEPEMKDYGEGRLCACHHPLNV